MFDFFTLRVSHWEIEHDNFTLKSWFSHWVLHIVDFTQRFSVFRAGFALALFLILLVEGYLIVVSLINYPFSYVSVVFVEF